MESLKNQNAPVLLKGTNYLLWSRTIKIFLGGKGLWKHVTHTAPTSTKKAITEGVKEGEEESLTSEEEKWFQDDQMVLGIMQSSLEPNLLEAYSYCETPKDLWETLQKVFGNVSNLSRVFEVKKAISDLKQEDMEFNAYFGKFRALWAELEMLRPFTLDSTTLRERGEQDKVFGLLLNINSNYKDLVKHILRSDKPLELEDVCSQIQKEQGTLGLFGAKRDLVLANKVELANKAFFKGDGKRNLFCDHCKKENHTKDKCWILHPHLKPDKFNERGGSKSRNNNNFRANQAHDGQGRSMEVGGSSHGDIHKSLAMVSYNPQGEVSAKEEDLKDYVKKADLEALIKAIKEATKSGMNGNEYGSSLIARQMMKNLILDSGASHHMISNPDLIENVKPILGHVVIANGDKIPIKGIGSLRVFDKESKAFYMPTFTSNLLSISRITNDLNCEVVFGPNKVVFQDIETKDVLGKGGTKEGLYTLEDLKPNSILLNAFNSNVSVDECAMWHARLGHPHSRALGLMLPSLNFKNDDCEACILGKHCRTVFPKSSTIYESCFDLIHSDVWTSPCISRDNLKYFVTFIDEKSKYTWLTLMPSKDRVLDAFKNFQSYVTNTFNAKIKIFRSDNGGEYTSNAFKDHLASHGILHQTSCPYTPQQNGVAERKNRHLMEVARSMMFHRNVPKRYWADAVVMACYLINRIPTRILEDVSPYEVLNKSKPTINHLRVFGCVCFVLIPGELRTKLDAKSTRAMFIGYSSTQKGYKCYDPDTRRVLTSRDVRFIEHQGFYGGKDWEGLKDISSSCSDRAKNLRNILENLGLNMNGTTSTQPSTTQPTNQTTPLDQAMVERAQEPDIHQGIPPLDHEGDNQSEAISHHDQDVSVHDQEEESHAHQDEETSTSNEDTQSQENQVGAPVLRRSTRIRKPASNWINTRVYYNSQAVAHPIQKTCDISHLPLEHQVFLGKVDQGWIPRTYEEAIPHKEWREAIHSELNAMKTNETWYAESLPKGKRAVSSKWVFTIKYKSSGEVERYKARLVARGFTQTYGEDYLDTFAPVAKLHTVRVLLSIATNLGWDLWQMDVKNAFLQGELEEEVYMKPPPGLEGSISHGKVLRLKKAIYGLKQSPRAWYHKLSSTLTKRGFTKSERDHTLFTLQGKGGIVVILIYVDDIIITGDDRLEISSTKEFLKTVFDIKDLGELKYFLGIEVCRSKNGLFLSQRKYTLDLLGETGKIGSKPAKTPLEEGYKVSRQGELEEKPYEDQHQYRRMVGKLIYLTITRPDICFAVNQISQHMQSPMEHHWKMVDRILRYLKNAPGQGIWMGKNNSTEIVGYCDADWAGDRIDRKSTTGYCTFIGGNLVTWKSKKQKIVSCSSAEAEYRAMRKLTNELTWLKGLLEDLGLKTNDPMTMHCDNQAAIHIASNNVFHERTKHIEVDCHKVRQMVEKGVILPCYTRSQDQLADIFTKAASLRVCEFIHAKLGLTNFYQE